ncbi:MAG TPA: M15 family metallopeptidase [Steroidobacteraceae bacterium]|nr:M15 family metallopeptidase [Steroidobacteraceae bacterium]
MNAYELTGQVRTHVTELPEPRCTLHVDVAAPFLNMRRAALADGFEVEPASSFRDFPRQLSIWNAKFTGERTVLDAAGAPIDVRGLAAAERIEALLLWSALPGASRHHWGTDLDLIDRRATPSGYQPRLTPDEYDAGGPYAPLFEWLEENAARWGFFRPYRGARSGVAAEPWHFSFAPLAEPARNGLTPKVLRAAIETTPMLGKDEVIARIEELHARYVAVIDWP